MKAYTYKYFLESKFENWDPNLYEWKVGSMSLLYYCSNYFKIWWTPDKFNWENEPECLIKHCKKYKHIWYKDYIIRKLEQ